MGDDLSDRSSNHSGDGLGVGAGIDDGPINADPGSKSTNPYKNDDQVEAFLIIHEGKVDKGDGENSSCEGGRVEDRREREGMVTADDNNLGNKVRILKDRQN